MSSAAFSKAQPTLVVVAAEDLFSREADWLQQIALVAQAALRYPVGSVAIQLRPRSVASIADASSLPRTSPQESAAPGRVDCADRIRHIFTRIDPHGLLPVYVSERARWLHTTATWRWHVPEAQLQMPQTVRDQAWSAAVHGAESAQRAQELGAHLLLFAPVFAPSWKPARPVGVQGLAAVTRACQVAVLALGGMTPARVVGCLEAGAAGVAVASGIMLAEDVEAMMRQYAKALGLSEVVRRD